jgi:hypothetical protein
MSEHNNKKLKKSKSFMQQIIKLDLFGEPISLTYKDNRFYDTNIGTFFTLLLGFTMLGVGLSLLVDLGDVVDIFESHK